MANAEPCAPNFASMQPWCCHNGSRRCFLSHQTRLRANLTNVILIIHPPLPSTRRQHLYKPHPSSYTGGKVPGRDDSRPFRRSDRARRRPTRPPRPHLDTAIHGLQLQLHLQPESAQGRMGRAARRNPFSSPRLARRLAGRYQPTAHESCGWWTRHGGCS